MCTLHRAQALSMWAWLCGLKYIRELRRRGQLMIKCFMVLAGRNRIKSTSTPYQLQVQLRLHVHVGQECSRSGLVLMEFGGPI